MKTTAEWLAGIENDRALLEDWLKKQYRGEVRASIKVAELAETIEDPSLRTAVDRVADDEGRHAAWIRAILKVEGVEVNPDQENADDRYWRHVMDGELSQDELLAAGAHAEQMRLVRIEAIMNSGVLGQHIIAVFRRIYEDEVHHARIFSQACTPEAYAKMSEKHQAGLAALGLEI
ncbi:hypothetical protein FDI24_gp154 [Acidovorax phage ACP17]|uniref:Rubrerythrin diiron-binding domain-containing protein n=1 Tax=Acidovorax phage ACP17 TaxID=2010329 RepID=A0A218M313_9CAUD|nr:hypothetical protein FDI24_gp154 [Acidovorax phage ACP17]ASD50435.1 hypothetical protein [Acidovorax phage ACP17]